MIIELRNAIIRDIKTFMPALKTCKAHAGKFDLAGLQSLSLYTPAVLVACLGLSKPQAAGHGPQEPEARFVAFIITKDSRNLPRDEAALNIVEALSVWLVGRNFGMENVYPVEIADLGEAQNLHSSALGNTSPIALWGLSWNQRVRLGEDVFDDSNGVLLKSLYLAEDDHDQPILSSE